MQDALPVGTKVSSWRVDGELGRGGMASVHAVTHGKFGKRAAIKIAHRSILTDSYNPRTFLREARIVHRIDHPAVIDVFATGSIGGRPYLVMEKLEGMSLGYRLDQGFVSRAEAFEILIELCDVLRAAHAAGVVHRDLKLDNVYICADTFAGGRRVKLLDWGVAFVQGEEDPFRGLIAGTLTYVAPEQIRGDALTPAADIYSLAVLAYHLLCRRPPFAARTDVELIKLHLRAEPPHPREAWPTIPADLDALLVSMLAKNPAERPSLDEVERVLRDRLAQIAPVSAPETRRRLARGSHPAIPTAAIQEAVAAEAQAQAEAQAASDRALAMIRLPIDVLGRPALLPCPPFSPVWAALAIAMAALIGLLSALP
ncbi:MAG: serine/threonine protein kinase [Deltaproteobacteria bacterium]|nr:serine/threonine protein kinase [Deltaproteobacteria bacterium]